MTGEEGEETERKKKTNLADDSDVVADNFYLMRKDDASLRVNLISESPCNAHFQHRRHHHHHVTSIS